MQPISSMGTSSWGKPWKSVSIFLGGNVIAMLIAVTYWSYFYNVFWKKKNPFLYSGKQMTKLKTKKKS